MAEEIIRYDQAMHHAYAGKQYGCMGPAYEDITWLEDDPMPTREELEAIWNDIKADYNAEVIGFARKMNYPSTEELIVAMWEKMVEVDGITSDDIAAIQAKRMQVKADNPKD